MRPLNTITAAVLFAFACQNARALGDYLLIGQLFQKTKGGLLVNCKVTKPSSTKSDEYNGIVFLSGYPDAEKLFDGSPIKCKAELFDGTPVKALGIIIQEGTYQYTDVLGARRTVQAFTFSSLDTD